MSDLTEERGSMNDVDYGKPPYQGTRLRPVRIDDELWSDALTVAAARNESVSEEIRRALKRYVRRNQALLEPEPAERGETKEADA